MGRIRRAPRAIVGEAIAQKQRLDAATSPHLQLLSKQGIVNRTGQARSRSLLNDTGVV